MIKTDPNVDRLSHRGPRRARQRGAHAAAFIVTVVTLLFFAGLGMDSGRLFVVNSELQNAVDACALAAASQLGAPTAAQLLIAETQGKAVGALNRANFQSAAIAPADITVEFSTAAAPNSGFVNRTGIGTPANVKWVRCFSNKNNLQPFLVIASPTVSAARSTGASAVATLAPGTTACALPLAVCRGGTSGFGADPCYDAADRFNLQKGCWIKGRQAAGKGADTEGFFRWVKFDPSDTVSDMDALIKGSGRCNLSSPGSKDVTKHSGSINSFQDSWNGRFGVWKNPGNVGQMDTSGFAYTNADNQGKNGPYSWPSGKDAFVDFRDNKRANNVPWDGQSPDPQGPWNASTNAAHQAGGDRRMVTVPVINCAGPLSGTIVVDGFACVMLLNPVFSPTDWVSLEYEGWAGDPLSGCATSGFPGPGGGTQVPGLVR